MNTIEMPKDPAVLAFDEKKAAVQKMKRECGELSRQKDQRRHERSLELQSYDRALLDADGRDLGKASFEEEMRRLDVREGELRREIRTGEAELEALSRKRNKIIVQANRPNYVENLRRRARAVIEVARCNQIESEFHHEMQAADVSSGLRPMRVTRVGNWNDNQSMARFHVAELREFFPEFKNEDFEA